MTHHLIYLLLADELRPLLRDRVQYPQQLVLTGQQSELLKFFQNSLYFTCLLELHSFDVGELFDIFLLIPFFMKQPHFN